MKPYRGYLARLCIDEEEGIIRGKALNTRDTITFYGKTVEEALQAFRDSVDDYLDFCKETGIEPDQPFSGKLLVRIKPEYHRDLSLIAQEEGQSINSLIAQLLMETIQARAPRIHSPSVRSMGKVQSAVREPTDRPRSSPGPRPRRGPSAPRARDRAKAK